MKILSSVVVKIMSFAACFVAVFVALCRISVPFNRYVFWRLGWNLFGNATPAVLLSLGFFAVFCVSIWKSNPTKNRIIKWFDSVDLILLTAITVGTVFLFAHILMNRLINAYTLLIFPFAAFTAVMMLTATTIARIRDKKWKQTIIWIAFYQTYPIYTPAGAVMSVLHVGHILGFFYAIATGWNTTAIAFVRNVNIPLLAIVIANLTIATFFCRFILTLAASYEKANEDKIKSERFKAELITNVSHDIRTPLTSVINYVDLMKRLPAKDAVLAEYISVLDKKSQRLKTLIDDLLEASKAGTGNINVKLQTIHLTEMIGQISGEFDGAFADHQLTFVFSFTQEKAAIIADGSLLWRVVENVFSNAAKYAMPGTRVYGDIMQEDGIVSFSLKNVSKEPLNISPEELTERFVRGDRSRSDEGNGLGLYIAQNLMELMGGRFVIRISGDLFEVVLIFGENR